MRFQYQMGQISENKYDGKIWLDIDTTNEKFTEVNNFLIHLSAVRCNDGKFSWKYPKDDMRRYEEDNAHIRSWEFEKEEDLEIFVKYLEELGFTEDLDMSLYKYN